MEKYTGILEKIIMKAQSDLKTIVLPESKDIRVLKAANIIVKNNIANIIIIGERSIIENICKENNIVLDSNIKTIDNKKSNKLEEYALNLYELRKNKNMTLEKARALLEDEVYFATMMVKLEEADGMVSGACHSTSDTLRPALQIIKAKEEINTVSAFFLMESPKKEYGSDGVFIFADCGLVEFPTKEQLYDIVKSSVVSFKTLVDYDSPRVAMLSYSTKGSAKNERIDNIINVTNRLKSENIDFDIDGELQLDAAIVKEVARFKAPESNVAGRANILIFPDLQAGNIGYKLVQRFGDALALGPITQGLNRPINDLSRGCDVKDIVGAVAITSVQAQNNNM